MTAGIPCGSVGSPGPIGFDIPDRLCPVTQLLARTTGVSTVVCLIAVLAACSSGETARSDSNSVPNGPFVEAPSRPEEVCQVTDSRLTEISGLAASTQHPGILWTHNDSGDRAQVFALDALTCQVRAVVRLAGVSARDTEAISVGKSAAGVPTLWLADIGDNAATQPNVRLYRFREPSTIKDQTINVAATIRVKYVDEPYNAEALLVDPAPAGRMWIATRRQATEGAYYELPAAVWGASSTVTVKPVGSVPALTTDATFAPDGRTYAIRTYFGGTQFAAPPPGTDAQSVDIGFQGQSEALTYSYDSRFLYTISEGSNQPLLKVPLP